MLAAAINVFAATERPEGEPASWQSSERKPAAEPSQLAPRGTCTGIPITQSVEPNIVAGPSVWCGNQTTNAETSLARSFVATENSTIGCIEFGITENWDPPWTVYVRVLQGSISGPYANLTLLAETPVVVPTGTNLEILTADIPDVLFVAGTEYVVELRTPSRLPVDGGDGGLLALGCNNLGETAPTYIRAPACGATNFLPLAAVGYGNRHLVLSLIVLEEIYTVGTILCADGTPLANCAVSLAFFDSGGSPNGWGSALTNASGYFSTTAVSCSGTLAFGFTVTTPCCPNQSWTVYSGCCCGDAGTLICNDCDTPPTGTGEVWVFKFRDDDCDGVWDPSEPFLSGWQIILTNADTGQQYNVLLGPNSLPYGTYIVTEVPQPGFRPPCKAGRVVINPDTPEEAVVSVGNCPCPAYPFGEDIGCGTGWQVISTPPNVPGALPRPANLVTAHSAWDQNVCWMSAAPNGNISLPSGTYVYEHCFCLDERFTNPLLDLCVKADNTSSVFLNGVLIGNGIAYNAPGCGAVTTTDPWLFRPGQNCIQIAVDNAGGPTGVSVSGVMVAENGHCCYDPCPCVLAPRNMYGWWMLDEASGPTAFDSAGFANDGVHAGGPAIAAGQVNSARRYDGTNDYTEIANHADLNVGSGEFSVDAWIRTNNPNGVIVSKRYVNFLSDWDIRGFALSLASGALLLDLATGPLSWDQESFAFVGPSLADGRWHHVAATVRRGSPFGVKLYVDGVPQSFATAIAGTLSTPTVFRIGSRTDTPTMPPGEFFNGAIDEVEFFRRALSPREIYRIWRAGSNGKCRLGVVLCGGDVNCDGIVDFFDIDFFVAALGYPEGEGWPYGNCPWENADADYDGNVDFFDIDPFVGLLGTTCE